MKATPSPSPNHGLQRKPFATRDVGERPHLWSCAPIAICLNVQWFVAHIERRGLYGIVVDGVSRL